MKRVVKAFLVLACLLLMCVCARADVRNSKNKVKPIILSPKNNDKVYSGDSLALRYYAQADKDCCIMLSDEKGIVFTQNIKSGDLLRKDKKSEYVVGRGGMYLLPPDILEPEKRYSLQVVSDFIVSEPVYFSTFTGGEEVIDAILEKHRQKKSLFSQNTEGLFESAVPVPFVKEDTYKASVDAIAPREYFKSSALSKQMMETIEVEAWKLDENGNRYPSTVTLTVNRNLKNNYINAFKELYALAFPIKSVGCYNYRNTHGGRLSEHALGTAVDINPDENYCRYSDGVKVGKLFAPYENPYSVTPEVVNIFKRYGFSWGGEWTGTVDYMHFSYFDT